MNLLVQDAGSGIFPDGTFTFLRCARSDIKNLC
jgi:hypothetical protein